MNKHITPDAAAATASQQRQYLSATQVAGRYNVSTDTIWRWSRNGDLPRPVKLSPGSTRWRLSDLLVHEESLRASFMFAFFLPINFLTE